MFTNPIHAASLYTDFCRDADGRLWIGTDRGLMRFDGYSYDQYLHDENNPGSLSDNRILKVVADSHGRVWVLTANGLNLYNPDTDSFIHISLPSMSYGGYITDLTELNDGSIIFFAAGSGLYQVPELDNISPVAVKCKYSLPDDQNLECLTQGPDGLIYIGTPSGKVYITGKRGYCTTINVTNSYITDIITENDGNILVSTYDEIYRIDIAHNRAVTCLMNNNNQGLQINNLSRSVDGTIYFSTSTNGLWHIPPGSPVPHLCSDIYLPAINTSNSKMGSVFADNEGNLWIGYHYRGFACIPRRAIPFSYRLIADALPDFKGGIDGLAVMDDRVIIGYGKKIGIFSLDGKTHIQRQLPCSGNISTIIASGPEKLLVGVVNDGVWEFDTSNGASRRVINMPGKYPSVRLCNLPNGHILAGFHGVGLMKYDPKNGSTKWYQYNKTGGRLNNPYFTSMSMSPDGRNVWLGLYGGLSCYDVQADTLRAVDQIPFIKGATYSVTPINNSEVLAGTSHGLLRFHLDKGLLKEYTTTDGMTDNDVRSVVKDKKGNCWIGTKQGLSCLSAGSDTIVAYYGGYGLFETAFPYAYALGDNTILLGSDLGLTSFNPDRVPSPGFDRPICATSLMLNGTRINPSTEIAGHRVMNSGNITRLHLPYENNSLTVSMSTMDYRDAANVRYAWTLEGYNDNWNYTAPGVNTIHLPHLSPGTYRMRVKALDNNVTSDELILTIAIATPWYMNTFMKIFYVVIVIALITLTWLVMQKKREQQVNDEKIKFFIDVSHDIRSPITLILTPLESLLKEPFDKRITDKLHTMHRNSLRILSLVNQLLDLRKIEKGGMRLLCSATNLPAFVSELVDMFKPQASDKNITLTFENRGDLDNPVWLDRQNFDKILVNIISNAIKYTPEGGEINVTLSRVTDETLGPCAEVSVIDTGIGLGNKSAEQIFQRFYRARENHAGQITGAGIGLDLCRQLTLLHHGSITGHNRTDGVNGSIFTVRIPLNKNAYAAGEIVDETTTESIPAKHIIPTPSTTLHPESVKRRRPATKSKRILLVDDDPEMRSFIQSSLDEDYKTITAANGAEALKIVCQETVDLIVCDVKMPVMDGLTFLQLLKTNVNTHHIPIIMLSSKNELSDRIEGWSRGADAYLGKPFSIEELDSVIDNLIGNRLKLKGKFSGIQDTDNKIAQPQIKGPDELLLDKIIRIINDNIENPELNVEMLGQSAGISRVHLHRRLKDLIGMNPSDFIRNIRLQRACKLLQKQDIEITQVAYAVGFTSQPHFSTAFKRYTGFSPTVYRQRFLSGESLPPIEKINIS